MLIEAVSDLNFIKQCPRPVNPNSHLHATMKRSHYVNKHIRYFGSGFLQAIQPFTEWKHKHFGGPHKQYIVSCSKILFASSCLTSPEATLRFRQLFLNQLLRITYKPATVGRACHPPVQPSHQLAHNIQW